MAAKSDLKVGYIGLGNMGGPMAANIAKAGFDLTVFDLRGDALEALERDGARRSASVAELAAEVDILSTCVQTDPQVRDIFLSDDGILNNAKSGLIAVIQSSIYPKTVLEIDQAAREKGVQIIDAPVSGTHASSQDGELTLMVGGSDEAVARAQPVFDVCGRTIRVGDVGMGQVIKLGNNIMSQCNMVVAMEAVRFVESFGVDKSVLFEVAQVSSGASYSLSHWENWERLNSEHTLAGTPALVNSLPKDLLYALTVAQERWTYLPIVSVCSQLIAGMFAERWNVALGDDTATRHTRPDNSLGWRHVRVVHLSVRMPAMLTAGEIVAPRSLTIKGE